MALRSEDMHPMPLEESVPKLRCRSSVVLRWVAFAAFEAGIGQARLSMPTSEAKWKLKDV